MGCFFSRHWRRDLWHNARFIIKQIWLPFDDLLFRGRTKYGWKDQLRNLLRRSENSDLQGKWAIVTGANSGIGFALSWQLARCGAGVILACRDEGRGRAAEGRLRSLLRECPSDGQPAGPVEYLPLDVSDLASVKAFMEKLRTRSFPIKLLVCNAGGMATPFSLSPQGFEVDTAAHILGHAMLAQSLLPDLGKQLGRVIFVSSATAPFGQIKPDFFSCLKAEPQDYNRFDHYKDVKCMQLCYSIALAKHAGSSVAVHAVHPGAVQSNVTQNMRCSQLMAWMAAIAAITPEEAASYVLRACLADDASPELGNGKYFHCGYVEDTGPKIQKMHDSIWQLTQAVLQEGNWLSSSS